MPEGSDSKDGTVTAATRRDARERAVELLYESHAKGIDVDEIVTALPLTPDAYALELARGVADHQIELDRILTRHARRWPVDRMAVTDRSVLRIGAFELATKPDVPTGAALSEAVELGGQYGSTDDTSRFVNGILAAVADEVRGSRPWRPIDVVVFDMDGVIRHWLDDQVVEAEQELGLPAGSVHAAAFADPGFREVTHGAITAEAWAAAIGATLAAEHEGVSADDVASLWLRSNWRIDDDVVTIVGGLKAAGTKTALFSNASTKLEADMEEMGIADVFPVVANSSRIGMAKPDVPAFEHVASMLDADPASLLFVDDRPENVGGAVDAGWHAVQMRSAYRLGGVLRRLGIPGAPDPA
ncbi:transcription antitermination factor NusB [Actinospongicola halichondriae]|uniref:transcription antitermination factor NusB n=1 Tax=Actinospongicola halichondriae TaxID=3236844 RepID=UPI003D419CD3